MKQTRINACLLTHKMILPLIWWVVIPGKGGGDSVYQVLHTQQSDSEARCSRNQAAGVEGRPYGLAGHQVSN